MVDFSELMAHHLLDHPIAVGPGGFHFTKLMAMETISAVITAAIVIVAGHVRQARTAMEALILFLREDIIEPAMGHDGDAYEGYILTLFFFLFFTNLLGLVPGGATATGNISVTAALSALTFLLINGSGIVRHGFFKHFKNLVPHGVPWPIVPLIFAIELMGYFTKCIALTIRLFANMTAGHIVILVFLGLILMFGESNPWAGLFVAPFSVVMAFFICLLEIIVAGIQAYVFTMLTAIFVGAALHPEH